MMGLIRPIFEATSMNLLGNRWEDAPHLFVKFSNWLFITPATYRVISKKKMRDLAEQVKIVCAFPVVTCGCHCIVRTAGIPTSRPLRWQESQNPRRKFYGFSLSTSSLTDSSILFPIASNLWILHSERACFCRRINRFCERKGRKKLWDADLLGVWFWIRKISAEVRTIIFFCPFGHTKGKHKQETS